ncbi:MAG: hypothetical protein K5770_06165 [Lachnospiraceae bacterium]|nr:hypothetical protein [Lachnospiraceae bacterium]
MPHSSGGGSSGGGSHGGSRGSRGNSNPRFGSNYYPGAHRYVYYVNRQPRYYFSDKKYTLNDARSKKRSGIFGGILWAVFSVFIFLGSLDSVHIPKKVDIDYNTGVIIEDSIDVISDKEETEMAEAFSRFREDTGVTPSFIAVSDDEWRDGADSLETYAYRAYVSHFDDEKHWLVVYASEGDRESFSWEGMIGDDCGGMITSGLEDEFTKKVQENLWASSRYTVSEAICQAFEDIDRDAQKVQFDPKAILVLLIAAAAVGFGVFKIISAIKVNPEEDPMLQSSQCMVDQEKPREDTCRYCGGIFAHGLHKTCPYCGAPAEAEDYG